MECNAAYGLLAAWAGRLGESLKAMDDPVARARELGVLVAKLRLTKTHAPEEPDRSAVRAVVLSYLEARGERVAAADEERRITEVIETLVTEAAAKIIAFKESQPYLGCGGTATPKNKPLNRTSGSSSGLPTGSRPVK